MNRAQILEELKAMHGSIARPLVATSDMGIEHCAANSYGGYIELGRYGSWPVAGPIKLYEADLSKICNCLNVDVEKLNLKSDGLSYLLRELNTSFEYRSLAQDHVKAILDSLKGTLKSFLVSSGPSIYFYFDSFNDDQPSFFVAKEQVTKFFMEQQDLTQWDDMSDEELEYWLELIEEDDTFLILEP